MKWKFFLQIAAILTVVLLHLAVSGAGDEPVKVPVAVVPESGYSFAPVVDGTQIAHDFIMKNEGTAELKIEKIKTG